MNLRSKVTEGVNQVNLDFHMEDDDNENSIVTFKDLINNKQDNKGIIKAINRILKYSSPSIKSIDECHLREVLNSLIDFNKKVSEKVEEILYNITKEMSNLWIAFKMNINNSSNNNNINSNNNLHTSILNFLEIYLTLKERFDSFVSGYHVSIGGVANYSSIFPCELISNIISIEQHEHILREEAAKMILNSNNDGKKICLLSFHGLIMINLSILTKQTTFRNNTIMLSKLDQYKEETKHLSINTDKIKKHCELLKADFLKVTNSTDESIWKISFPDNHTNDLSVKFLYFFLLFDNDNNKTSIKYKERNSIAVVNTIANQPTNAVVNTIANQPNDASFLSPFSHNIVGLNGIFQALTSIEISSLELPNESENLNFEHILSTSTGLDRSTVFRIKEYFNAAAALNIAMEKGYLKMEEFIITIIFVIFNHPGMNEKLHNIINNGEHINSIFNQLVTDLTDSTFKVYLTKFTESNKWTAVYKASQKTNVRKRYSRSLRSLLIKLDINPLNNLVYRRDFNNPLINEKLSLVINDYLIPYFNNNVEEDLRIFLINNYFEEWNTNNGDARDRIFDTTVIRSSKRVTKTRDVYSDQSKQLVTSGSCKKKIRLSPATVVPRSPVNLDKDKDTVFGILGHRILDDGSIEFEVDWTGLKEVKEDEKKEFTPLEPDLCTIVVVFDYLRENNLSNYIPEEFKSNSITSINNHSPKHGVDIKNIEDITFTIERENSNLITNEKYNNIISSDIDIKFIDEYISNNNFLKKLAKPLHLLVITNNTNNANINSNNYDDNNNNNNYDDNNDDDNNNNNNDDINNNDNDNSNKSDSDNNEKSDSLVTFISNNKKRYFDSKNQKKLEEMIKEYKKLLTPSINSLTRNITMNYDYVIKSKVFTNYNSFLLDFSKLVECSAAEIKDFNNQIMNELHADVIEAIILKNKIQSNKFASIIIQNCLADESIYGPIYTTNKEISLKLFTYMYDVSKASESDSRFQELSIQRRGAYLLLIDIFIDLLNTILCNSPSKQTLFLPRLFLKQYGETTIDQFKKSIVFKRIAQSDKLIFVKSNMDLDYDFIISVSFKDNVSKKEINASIDILIIFSKDNIDEKDSIIDNIKTEIVKILREIYSGHYRKNFIPLIIVDQHLLKLHNTDNSIISLIRNNTLCGCMMIYTMYKLSGFHQMRKIGQFINNSNKLRTDCFHNLLLYYLVLNEPLTKLEHSYDSENDDNNDNNDNNNKSEKNNNNSNNSKQNKSNDKQNNNNNNNNNNNDNNSNNNNNNNNSNNSRKQNKSNDKQNNINKNNNSNNSSSLDCDKTSNSICDKQNKINDNNKNSSKEQNNSNKQNKLKKNNNDNNSDDSGSLGCDKSSILNSIWSSVFLTRNCGVKNNN